MKNIDDQMSEIFRRSDILKIKRKDYKAVIGYVVSIAACLALMVAAIAAVLTKSTNTQNLDAAISRYGSLIVTAPYMGYVIVGILAFVLGVLVTLLCKKLAELKKLEDN